MVQNFPSKGLLGSDRQKCDVFPGQLSPGKLWQRDWYFQEITRWKNRSWSIWQSLFCSDYAYRKILKIFWHFQIILWSQALRWPKRVHTHFVNTNMAEISWYVRGKSTWYSLLCSVFLSWKQTINASFIMKKQFYRVKQLADQRVGR